MTAKRSRSPSAARTTRRDADVAPTPHATVTPAARWWGVAAIVLLVVVAHGAALPGGFVWEDLELIALNPHIVSPAGLHEIWFDTSQPDYWPVDYSLLWLEYRIWGPWPPGYRAVNLIWHALNAVLLWHLLARLRVPGAWLCGAIFAVHPTTVESVAWCTQSKTLLSTTFAFLSLACYLLAGEAWDAESSAKAERLRGAGWYVSALLLFLLGLLTKSSIVMWPFVLLVARWWQRRRWTWKDFVAAAPFFLLSLALGLVALWFKDHRSIGADAELIRNDGMLSRLALAGRAIWFYVGKTLLPVRLSLVYARWPLGVSSPWAFLPDVALVAVAIAAWRYRRACGAAVLAAGAYTLLNLFPVLGITNIYFMRYSLVSDHWLYLALPGLLALFVGGAAYIAQQRGMSRMVASVLSAGLLLVLVGLCASRASVYRGADNEQLWSDVLAQDPASWVAHHELGRVYSFRADHQRALGYFAESLQLNPTHGLSALNLGLQYMFLARESEAVPHFRRAVELEPTRADAYFYLAMALLKTRDTAASVAQLRENVEKFPQDARSLELLTLLLAASPDAAIRNGAEAVALGERLCALSATPAAGHLDSLAAAYAEAGRYDDAERMARRALAQALAEDKVELAQNIRARLQLYANEQPYRRPS